MKSPPNSCQEGGCKLYLGDCLEVMKTMQSDFVHSVITDPPYGLNFMGKEWDHGVPGIPFWEEALRVAKPGAYLLAFGGTRTFHRLTCAIEDAGWQIRDCIMWVYGTGWPKSHDISKAVLKNEPNHDWDGWGTGLKPAWEPIIVAMKPLDGTFASNAIKYGVAGLNIDDCRVATEDKLTGSGSPPLKYGGENSRPFHDEARPVGCNQHDKGRWPANLIHDGSEEVTDLFPVNKSGVAVNKTRGKRKQSAVQYATHGNSTENQGYYDQGSAARFFYCAKVSTKERGKGNKHPSVKPLALMEYLCRLTMPPTKGIVLDPFMGSGTTGIACENTGRSFIGIESNEEYYNIAKNRTGIL